ncbi:MAG: glycoside hydrolase family 16 protein [Clostridiales bacterium]|nr:glycoside hydrolase family 16 protein [Clostridiales bacterium]
MESRIDATHAPSLLPEGKRWNLVWNDEFDGDILDRTKWDFRLYLMQRRHSTFTDEGATLDGDSHLLLNLIERDGHYYSPHLQTGSNYLDRPGASYGKFTWPVGKIEKPGFMHKYGYYEIRCKLQTQPGWWSAFWLQSPLIGSTLNPAVSGVEIDIMENFTRDGVISHNIHWNGYGDDHGYLGSGDRKVSDTADGWHYFGCHWSREGYVFYVDGQESWRVDGPVSDTEQFLLISTECMGYRRSEQPDEKLKKAVLPDAFVVDFVRVYDEVK